MSNASKPTLTIRSPRERGQDARPAPEQKRPRPSSPRAAAEAQWAELTARRA